MTKEKCIEYLNFIITELEEELLEKKSITDISTVGNNINILTEAVLYLKKS